MGRVIGIALAIAALLALLLIVFGAVWGGLAAAIVWFGGGLWYRRHRADVRAWLLRDDR